MSTPFARGPFCGFVIFWDGGDPDSPSKVYWTWAEANAALRAAEEATAGNVYGSIHGVSRSPVQPPHRARRPYPRTTPA